MKFAVGVVISIALASFVLCTFRLCPRHSFASRVEAPANHELPISIELRLDSVFPVIAQQRGPSAMICGAYFPERFWLSRYDPSRLQQRREPQIVVGRHHFDRRRMRQRVRGPNIADAMMATMTSSQT